MTHNKFTYRQRAAILKDYLSGVPTHYIAKVFGCSASYPAMLAKRCGHEVRARPRTNTGGRTSTEYEARAWQRAREIGPVVA